MSADCVIDTVRHLDRTHKRYVVECVNVYAHECDTEPREIICQERPSTEGTEKP